MIGSHRIKGAWVLGLLLTLAAPARGGPAEDALIAAIEALDIAGVEAALARGANVVGGPEVESPIGAALELLWGPVENLDWSVTLDANEPRLVIVRAVMRTARSCWGDRQSLTGTVQAGLRLGQFNEETGYATSWDVWIDTPDGQQVPLLFSKFETEFHHNRDLQLPLGAEVEVTGVVYENQNVGPILEVEAATILVPGPIRALDDPGVPSLPLLLNSTGDEAFEKTWIRDMSQNKKFRPLLFDAIDRQQHGLYELFATKALLPHYAGQINALGQTPLMAAAWRDDQTMVERIIAISDPDGLNRADVYGRTARWFAADLGHEEILALLDAAGARSGTRACWE
ncbi:ankyrin repeat domain-containing protein [Ruegeria sp. HKCCD4332]|uniref:ankyrin repeat domain-containing protein n=1 Tax=Ruegeria sp. HKCCD4332 TaxID=2683021 RepID=UPI00149290E8|nr:ankyrin repeat domain-containing protein [Ruegeria sp. HKCCD4332]NOD78843.1 hypothetical protein [Ruegeria sp. HKCCD4332]